MNDLRWMRVVSDTAFAVDAVLLTSFVAGLATGHSYRPSQGFASARRKGCSGASRISQMFAHFYKAHV